MKFINWVFDADYRRMIELKPGDVTGYMGLGRNEMKRKNFAEAIKQFDYVTKLASDFSSGYSFRAEALLEQKKWAEICIANLKSRFDENIRKLTDIADEQHIVGGIARGIPIIDGELTSQNNLK